MRKAFRHSGVLMMVAVVALGLLGAAYTMWFEDLQINSQVSTGTFDADVSIHPWDGDEFGAEQTGLGAYNNSGQPVVIVCDEPISTVHTRNAGHVYAQHTQLGPEGPTSADDCTFGGFPANKLDSTTDCDALIGNWGTVPPNANDVTDQNELTLLIGNAFPYAGCSYLIDIHNSGSVPMHVNALPPALGDYLLCPAGTTIATAGIPPCTALNLSDPAISVIYGSCFGAPNPANGQLMTGPTTPLQIHPGQAATCEITVLLDQGDNLEGKVIIARSRLRAYQWNESLDTTP